DPVAWSQESLPHPRSGSPVLSAKPCVRPLWPRTPSLPFACLLQTSDVSCPSAHCTASRESATPRRSHWPKQKPRQSLGLCLSAVLDSKCCKKSGSMSAALISLLV